MRMVNGGFVMIDEIREAEDYINGKNIVKENLYRICYLMSCYYKSQNIEKLETRQKIFEWGRQNNIWIKYDVNQIITRAYESPNSTFNSPVIKINKQDIVNIKDMFDGHKVRKVALALLCYAKAYANKNREFYISSVALGAWLGINRKALRNRYIKELIDFGYLQEVHKRKNSNIWDQPFSEQGTKYKINNSLHNSGEHVLESNDIDKLYLEIFSIP